MALEADDAGNSLSLRVASFSYYLDTAKDNLLLRQQHKEKDDDAQNSASLTKKSFLRSNPKHGSSSFVFQTTFPAPTKDTASRSRFGNLQDGEIKVFAADRYFSMNLDHAIHTEQNAAASKPRHGTKATTPLTSTACSYAASHDPLFSPLQTTHVQLQTIPVTKKPSPSVWGWRRQPLFPGFGCGASCFNKRAVDVIDANSPLQPLSPKLPKKQEIFPPFQKHDESASDEPQRNSQPVFGSKRDDGYDVHVGESTQCLLSWDDTMPNKGLKHAISPAIIPCDEIGSEASSDLFEIDNLAGPLQPPTFSELSAMTMISPRPSATSNCPPSEASIQWSVVTASVADFSEYYDNEENMMTACVAGVRDKAVGSPRLETGNIWVLGSRNLKPVQVADKCHRSSYN